MISVLLAALVLSQDPGVGSWPDKCRNRTQSRMRTCGNPPFDLFTTYSFAANSSTPIVSDPVGLVALCRVSAAGTSWECVDGVGAAFGTVTQGAGTTYQDTNIGPKAMSDVTTAKSPYLVSTTIDALWKADHTVVWAGYATQLSDVTNQAFARMDDGTNFFYVRNESGVLACTWSGAGGTRVANNSPQGIEDGWAVGSCRRSGNNHYSRTNGVDSVVVAGASISGNMTAASRFHFGEFSGSLPQRGPHAWLAFYSVAKTPAQLAIIERGFWGIDPRITSSTGTGNTCLDVDGGQNDCFIMGASMVGPAGLRTVRSRLANNKWAANATAAATWTDVGTPTVTSDVSAGPFFRWRNTNTGDLIVDDSAAAFEGKRGADGYTAAPYTNSYYTASCYLSAGTSGTTLDKARLQVDVTGGGWSDAGTTTSCDVTGLTTTPTRASCVTPLFMVDAGSPTVRGVVLVGTAVADTGSITTYQCQLSAGPYANVPVVYNTVLGDSSQTADPTTWPSTALGGKYEIVFTPYANANADWVAQSDTLYLFDAYTTPSSHNVIMLFGYSTPGRAMARTENGGSNTEFFEDGVSLVPGQLYAVSVEWRPDGAGTCAVKWRWNTCPGSIASCSATTLHGSASGGVCPPQPTDAKFANRYDNSVPTDVSIGAVRVYGP